MPCWIFLPTVNLVRNLVPLPIRQLQSKHWSNFKNSLSVLSCRINVLPRCFETLPLPSILKLSRRRFWSFFLRQWLLREWRKLYYLPGWIFLPCRSLLCFQVSIWNIYSFNWSEVSQRLHAVPNRFPLSYLWSVSCCYRLHSDRWISLPERLCFQTIIPLSSWNICRFN